MPRGFRGDGSPCTKPRHARQPDPGHLERAKAMRAAYRGWAVALARDPCRCPPGGTCDPCRARAFLAVEVEMAAAAKARAAESVRETGP